MNRLFIYTLLLPLWVSVFPRYSAQTPPPQAVVHAVLFYSPSCGHCQMVINNTLLPLFEQYGNQLSMVGIDITQSSGQTLFSAALQYFGLERSGVPFLVIGDTYLVGSNNIPQQFPGMIEEYLAQGGIDWPAIPNLRKQRRPQGAHLPLPAPLRRLPRQAFL
jgi:thiol-disulfide isomerase/thioredoxin